MSAGDSGVSLKVGQKAPAFTLPDENGSAVSLASLKGKKVVLYFYPKDHTPGCTQEACDFRDNFARLKSKGVLVFGISKDNAKAHTSFKAKHDLPFSLLTDETGKMLESYGAWGEKSMYGKKFMGIIRSTVIVDEEGKVLKTYPKVSVKGHVEQILEDIA